MKYLPILILMLALCGCRNRHPVEEEPAWIEDEPAPREESVVDPVDRLVEQARNEIKNRRYDDARVTLWGAFRRDRWHPAANVVYQDLMIDRGRFDIAWQEYTDLYHANKQRGDALWFHLRPLLMKKTPVTLESGPKLTEEERERLQTTLREARWLADSAKRVNARKLADDGEKVEAQTKVMGVLKFYPRNVEGNRIFQDLCPDENIDKLVEIYASMAEDEPQSGDMLYLAARAKARTNNAAAIEMLREGLILDLPGVWLRVGMAELARSAARDWPLEAMTGTTRARDLSRSHEGWQVLAREYFLLARAADPTNAGVIELEANKNR
ncbi:MAG: hypothetical protein IT462_17670 [Planctomycetes bacterium]|nr:hypothetical protein [Planctomycetota bacterium]